MRLEKASIASGYDKSSRSFDRGAHISLPSCTGSASWSFAIWGSQEGLSWEPFFGHPKHMTEPFKLRPFRPEKQRLSIQLLPYCGTGDVFSQRHSSHSTEEPHFRLLYPGFCSSCQDPLFMTIGQNRAIHRPVDGHISILLFSFRLTF